MIVSAIVAGLLYLPVVRPLMRHLEREKPNTKWYARYLELDKFILEYDKEQAEQKRLRLLPVRSEIDKLRQEVSLVSNVVEPLWDYFRLKRRWYSSYASDQDKVLESVARLSEIEEAANLIRARFIAVAEEASYEFHSLFHSISAAQRRCQNVLNKLNTLVGWSPPTRRPTAPAANANRNIRETTVRAAGNREVATPTPVTEIQSPTDRPEIPVPRVVIPPPPPKRRVLNRQLSPVPLNDYAGADRARMDIGDLGEIIALHYELRRVEAETQQPAKGKVIRVSQDVGNLGYDIQSISQGQKVFIEVKSTNGDFWRDFFLSANELAVMRRLGEYYWLYRIHELSRDDGSAKISIFRGCKEIETSFEFEPTNYKFVGRDTNEIHGTLFDL